MQDILDLLGISKKRADELTVACYDKIAEVQENPDNGAIGETVEHLIKLSCDDDELFFSGYIFGRLVQINSDILEKDMPWIPAHIKQLATAKDGRRTHPEFQ